MSLVKVVTIEKKIELYRYFLQLAILFLNFLGKLHFFEVGKVEIRVQRPKLHVSNEFGLTHKNKVEILYPIIESSHFLFRFSRKI